MKRIPNTSKDLPRKSHLNPLKNQNYHIISKQSKRFNNDQANTLPKTSLVIDTSADPNYNEVEHFCLDLIDKGYDPIDVLILARETFNSDKLDKYLYEMRDKGLI